MVEPGEVTNVIDAFDDGDTFDLNLSLGFEYSTKSAKIRRETSIAAPGLTTGGYTSNLLNVASYSETTSKLIPRLDVGVYKDLAVYFRLPIILSNSRELTDLDGSAGQQDTALAGAPGERLFDLPFKSPDRSGIEYFAAGIDVNVMNQARDRTKPTWRFGLEGRFPLGEPMHACTTKNLVGQVQCADPRDINRNGRTDPDIAYEDPNIAEREPGVGRGTVGLEVHTFLSKRIKYLEPYGGFSALFEFHQESSDYGLIDLDTSLVNMPPIVGSVVLGLMVIPWENREKFGRLTLDFRFTGEYHSEGRDYSELFDALGSSDAPSLRNPQWAAYKPNPDRSAGCVNGVCPPRSIVDEQSSKTYFTGLSDVQAYGVYRASASATWQASENVKFQLGVGFRHDQAHGISGDQQCTPKLDDPTGGHSGPCYREDKNIATGVPNPNYRAPINAVGRRFFVSESNTFDVFASGTVMF